MVYISDKQVKTMALIDIVIDEFGEDRWFTKHELPNITAHTMNALIDKGILESKLVDGLPLVYYRRIRTLKELE